MQVVIKGLEDIKRNLEGFSDRRFAAAVATALTRSAVFAKDQLKLEMQRTLDRPTPYALNSLYVKTARADDLVALVRFKDERASSGGTPATYFLWPEVHGGSRRQKGIEVALTRAGLLPEGKMVTPGPGALIDNYGNMAKSQIVQILSQLRLLTGKRTKQNMREGKAGISAQVKAGGRYFVISEGRKAGVYQREMSGTVTPVLWFVSPAQYQARFNFYEKAKAIADERMPMEIQRSIDEHIAKLAAKAK
jgi:hypothetical protein